MLPKNFGATIIIVLEVRPFTLHQGLNSRVMEVVHEITLKIVSRDEEQTCSLIMFSFIIIF